MRTAGAGTDVPLAPAAALALWTDLSRWPSFVEGFARLVEDDPGWPAPDARLVWESVPAGRGRVTEKVVESSEDRIATMVFEDRLAGRQEFRVAPGPRGAAVELSLEYTLTKYGPLGVRGRRAVHPPSDPRLAPAHAVSLRGRGGGGGGTALAVLR